MRFGMMAAAAAMVVAAPAGAVTPVVITGTIDPAAQFYDGFGVDTGPGLGYTFIVRFSRPTAYQLSADYYLTFEYYQNGVLDPSRSDTTTGPAFLVNDFGSGFNFTQSAAFPRCDLQNCFNSVASRITGFVDVLDGAPVDYTLTIYNSVPEPATWAMLIAGFGIVGGAMRRRNHAATHPGMSVAPRMLP
jgi:hypothetical protein